MKSSPCSPNQRCIASNPNKSGNKRACQIFQLYSLLLLTCHPVTQSVLLSWFWCAGSFFLTVIGPITGICTEITRSKHWYLSRTCQWWRTPCSEQRKSCPILIPGSHGLNPWLRWMTVTLWSHHRTSPMYCKTEGNVWSQGQIRQCTDLIVQNLLMDF